MPPLIILSFQIVFKNKASRPYSIYPHGLTIEKSEEGVNYPAGGIEISNGLKNTGTMDCPLNLNKRLSYTPLMFARQPVPRRPAGGDTHLPVESGGRGRAFRSGLAMFDATVPQRGRHTARHRLGPDRTNPHLQEPVAQHQGRAGKRMLPRVLEALLVLAASRKGTHPSQRCAKSLVWV